MAIRHATQAQLDSGAVVPAPGEMIYVWNNGNIVIGDGQTAGGALVGDGDIAATFTDQVGGITVHDDLTVDNDTVVTRDLSVGRNAAVTGTTTLTGAVTVNNNVTLGGTAARTAGLGRHTTADTAGNPLTVTAGGATSGATDKAGGQLVLAPGVSTGTGTAVVAIKGYTSAASTGTGDNTSLDRKIFGGFKVLTDESAVSFASLTIAANTSVAVQVNYAVEVFDGTDVQVEVGVVSVEGTNKAGAFSLTATKFGNHQTLTAGTMSVTFAASSANPSVLSCTIDTSLTPSTGFPKLRFSIENLGGQAIALT